MPLCRYHTSMVKRKTAVTPLLTHWSYCCLAISYRYIFLEDRDSMSFIFNRFCDLQTLLNTTTLCTNFGGAH